LKTDYSDKIFEGTYVVLSPRRTFPVGGPSELAREIRAPETNSDDLDIGITTATGTMVIKSGRITWVEVVGQPRWEKITATKERRLAIKTEGQRAGQSVGVGVAALERGIRWIPAYRLEVKGEPVKEAKLELEAMVINELADIEGAEMFFVVGVPHFLYKEMLSPLSLSTTFAGVSSFFDAGSSNRLSNAIMTQSRMGERQSAADGASDPSATVGGEETLSAMSADELFLYRSDQVALKKGERASIRLFSLTVPCAEVFEWTIPDAATPRYAEPGQSVTEDLSRGIWYALRLKNQTGMPWTTAPVLNFRDWKPLGQDILAFTPLGADTIVRVTPATEVVGTHKLEEKARERQTLRESGTTYEYDLVTVEGTVNLRNVKKQPVEVVITRPLVGEATEVSDGGAITREGVNLQSVNPRSVVKWSLTLPPGEKQLRYVYKIYVRR
ncbi:MAG: hypothetical protein ACRD68_04710, partial [Pyrinomonadaceae bacterium]